MYSTRIAAILCLCLVASSLAAPTETPAGQDTSSPEAPTTAAGESAVTPAQPAASEAPADNTATASSVSSAPTSAEPAAAAEPAPADGSSPSSTAPADPMALGSSHDSLLNTTTFTCYGRPIGYYADIDHECKVYHFCLLGDYNGEAVYQRISYLCLNETIFDQQALDCVVPAKVGTPCKDAPTHYEASNNILRQAIVQTRMNEKKETSEVATTVTPAPAA